MFQELMPLLAQRTLVLTLARVNSQEICVSVIPRPLKREDKEENSAVTTPLSMSGTPQELDQELPQQLVEFVSAHLSLSSSLQSAKEEMAAAAKLAKETAKKAAGTRANQVTTSSPPRDTEPRKSLQSQSQEQQPVGTEERTMLTSGSLFASGSEAAGKSGESNDPSNSK